MREAVAQEGLAAPDIIGLAVATARITMANCVFCRTPLTVHEQFAGTVCSNWKCRERWLEAKLIAYRAEAAQAVHVEDPASFPFAIVPHWNPELVSSTQDERQALGEFLNALTPSACVDSSYGHSDPAPADDPPELSAKLGLICGVCRGYCCRHGAANHAFLDSETLLRAQRERPELDSDDVVRLYLALLPDRHCRDACLYQGESGCALPRDLRANICNRYECRGLTAPRKQFVPASGSRAFVVVRHDNRIQRAAFIDGAEVKPYGVSAPALLCAGPPPHIRICGGGPPGHRQPPGAPQTGRTPAHA